VDDVYSIETTYKTEITAQITLPRLEATSSAIPAGERVDPCQNMASGIDDILFANGFLCGDIHASTAAFIVKRPRGDLEQRQFILGREEYTTLSRATASFAGTTLTAYSCQKTRWPD
jgi:hypothetical protein